MLICLFVCSPCHLRFRSKQHRCWHADCTHPLGQWLLARRQCRHCWIWCGVRLISNEQRLCCHDLERQCRHVVTDHDVDGDYPTRRHVQLVYLVWRQRRLSSCSWRFAGRQLIGLRLWWWHCWLEDRDCRHLLGPRRWHDCCLYLVRLQVQVVVRGQEIVVVVSRWLRQGPRHFRAQPAILARPKHQRVIGWIGFVWFCLVVVVLISLKWLSSSSQI